MTGGLLEHSLSGEPAGDQGTFLGKPPRGCCLCGLFLRLLMVLKLLDLFLLFALGPKSGVMSFFPWFRRRSC